MQSEAQDGEGGREKEMKSGGKMEEEGVGVLGGMWPACDHVRWTD